MTLQISQFTLSEKNIFFLQKWLFTILLHNYQLMKTILGIVINDPDKSELPVRLQLYPSPTSLVQQQNGIAP